MTLKNLFAKLSVIVVLLFMFSANSFAQTYVSNTNGNDVVGTGTALAPYKTIAKGILQTADGGTIIIDADTYNEAGPIDLTGGGAGKNLTFVAQTFNALTTVTVTNGIAVGTAKTVNLGVTGVKFQTGVVNLTAGTLNISGSNLVITSGGTITRAAGSLNVNPTTTNVNVTYTGTVDVTAGGELPASLGTGILTVGITAGKTLTATTGLSFNDGGRIVVNTGNVNFSTATFNYAVNPAVAAVTNNGVDAVTFSGVVSFNRTAGTPVVSLDNLSTGTLALNGGVSNNSAANITLSLNNTVGVSGTLKLGGGTVNGVVTNAAGKTLEIVASSTFSGPTVINAGTLKLNGNQLTLSGTTALTKTGNIISTTASTVGNGMLNVTGTVTTTGAGELPNVIVGGQLILTAAPVTIPVYGTFTLSSSTVGALTLNDNTVEIWGSSFSRTDNTPGNVAQGTGVLSFRGGLAQTFTPGASLVLYDMIVNKTASTVVTMTASLAAQRNLTIASGTLNVGDFNLNLQGAPSTFSNGGQAYSSSGIGYVVFEGASGIVTGAGQFGNILVNLSNAANTVTTASNIAFSGILFINQGDFTVAGGNTLTMNNALVANPTVKINTTVGNSASLINGGTVTYSANVNLYYFGANNHTVAGEWTGSPTKINDVTIATDGGTVVTGINAVSTINGILTVNGNTTLAQGANVYTLAGDAKTHSIVGTVTGGTLEVTGAGSAVNGTTSTAAGFNGAVNNLSFEPAANNANFTSSNLKGIVGNLTLLGVSTKTGATATVTMNPTVAVLGGNLLVGNATLGPVASVTINGSTTSTLTGNVVLTDGSLTLTRGGNSTVVGGFVTLTKGTLTLGSDVSVTGQTTQVAGNIDLNAKKYTQLGSGATPDYNRTGAGTVTNGTVVFNSTAAAIDVTPGATFVLPNVETVGTANGVTFNAALEIAGSLLIDNAGTVVQGAGTLTLSGNAITVTNDAGAFTGSATFKGASATLSLAQNYAFPTMILNTAGSLTVIGNPTATARTLTVGTAYTNTAGTLALGIHTLDVATAFTFTAGAITQTTGYLNLNVGGPVVPATGFSIDNLKVYTTTANFGTSAFTVVKNLVMAASLTTSADGKMTLGEGALVERQGNAFVLSNLPTFSANTDLKYSTYTGAANITTAKEVPNTVRNLTVLSDGGALKTILAKNITVTGILSLADMLDATTTASTAITMADGSTLELKIDGTLALDENLTKAGAMHLIYNGAANTTTRELGALVSGAYPAFSGNVTVKSLVAQNAPTTWNGTFTFDGNNYDLTAFNVNLGGSLATTTNGGTFINTGAAAFLSLIGSGNSTFALNGTWSVSANIKFRLDKTTNTDVVTLSGGNLDFATNGQDLFFKNGVIATGTNNVILRHSAAAGVPIQGYDRTAVTGTNSGHVVGNIRKNIDVVTNVGGNTPAIRLTRVEFPVGTAPTSPAYYRPMAFQFNTLPTATFNLTVNHVVGNPGGENGFPLTSGDLTITNYPGFYWLVKSDLTLQPQVKYDIEARADGYTDYQTDGVQNIRFIRRFDTNTDNPWLVQGGLGYDNASFDYLNTPLILSDDSPIIIVRGAEGAISSQGARFTYSQLNKAPVVTTANAAVTANEGDKVEITWTATDPDIGQANSVVMSIVEKPAAATFDPATKKFTWQTTFADAGVYNIKVAATDGVLTTYNTVVLTIVNVNNAPSFTAAGAAKLADQTVKSGATLNFTYLAIDSDADALTYTLTPAITPAFAGTATITATGVLTFTPVFADANKVFVVSVQAADGKGGTATTTANISVGYPVEKGDVDANGTVASADASQILQHVVGLITITGAQNLWAADANNDGVIGAIDAAWVLYKFANGVWPSASLVASEVSAEFGKLSKVAKTEALVDGNQTGTSTFALPISISNAKQVQSIYAEFALSNGVDFQNIQANLPEGWMVQSKFENGVLKVAMAGISGLANGNVAVINVGLKNVETTGEISGTLTINDNGIQSLEPLKLRAIPTEFGLGQNYPNPFNPTTSIKYQIAENANVSLTVYNMLGQQVKSLITGQQEAGYYTVNWDGTNEYGSKVASGIYIYRLQAGKYIQTLKMNLLK